MYIKYVLLILIILLTLMPINIVWSQQETNVEIHVNVVQTYANGTYTEFYAFDAEVTLTSKSYPNETYIGHTNNYGIVEFHVNRTDTYNLNINWQDAYYEPKTVHLRVDILNIIYEKVYKLARFFEGSQNTVAKQIILELPASISINFPQSTVNVTIISYELRAKSYQSNTWVTVEFLDESYWAIDPRTGYFYQMNYTVNVTLTTLAAGTITFLSVSNGTVNTEFSSLYYVPRGVSVNFLFTVITKKPEYYMTLNEINAKLDEILKLLLQLIDITNKTVVPKLFNIESSIANYSTLLIGKINEFSTNFFANASVLNVLSDKLSDIKQMLTSVHDTQNIFVNDYPFQTRKALSEYLGNMQNSLYANVLLMLAGVFIIIIRTSGTKEKKEREHVGAVVIEK